MIDYFALALTHGLIALAVFRMLGRGDLDRDDDGVSGPARDSGQDQAETGA